MKFMKNLLVNGLTLCLCFGIVGCGGGNSVSLSKKDFNVWTVSATEKILQEQDIDSKRFQNTSIQLGMFQNEYEASQIIISTKKDIKEVDVEVSDMLSGENKIPSKAVAVYYEKYLEVAEIFDPETNAETGLYPDGLIPLSAIKEYNENKVSAGKNQGIYVRFKTEEEQVPGVYTGHVSITCDGIVTQVPVEIEVYDFAVSEERHNKSIFLVDWNFWSGELNNTQEMYDAYVDALFEYRLSPNMATFSQNWSDIEYCVEKAYEYMQDPRCTNITIPYKSKMDSHPDLFEGATYKSLDREFFKETIRAYVAKSVETNFNMLSKSVCYFSFVDEAAESASPDTVKSLRLTAKHFQETLAELAEELRATYADYENQAFIEELASSLLALKQVQTDAYLGEDYSDVNAWCPKVNYYHTEAEREIYAKAAEKAAGGEGGEQWWYTCIYPRAPYPTYHTEDTLLSARLLSWMQAQYNVTGNLYWAVNIYVKYNGTNYESIDEYTTGRADRFPKCNGDGFLFYPGGQYGLDSPLPSMRLEAIRDGLEEFELLNSVKEYCKALEGKVGSVNMDKVISTLTTQLYHGTQVNTTEDAFYAARKQLKNVLSCMASSAGMMLLDIEDDGYGALNYKVYVNGDCELKKDGQAITTFEQVNGGKVYTVPLRLNNAVNSMTLSFEADGKTYEYPIVKNGSVKDYAITQLVDSFVLNTENVNSALTNREASAVNCAVGPVDCVKLTVGATEGSESAPKKQSVYVKGGFVAEINQNTSKLIIRIHNNGEEQTVNIRYKTSSLAATAELTTVTLKNGCNTFELDCSSIKWSSKTVMDYLVFVLGEDTVPQEEKVLYVVDVVAYSK